MTEKGDGITSTLRDTFEEHRRGRQDQSTNLTVTPEAGYVGDEITIEGSSLPENQRFELIWHSVRGRWGVIEGNEIHGPQYQPRTEQIATVRTNASGEFSQRWEIPEDYGGDHTIELRTSDGNTLAEAEFSVTAWFEIDRTTAELGETFTVVGYGLGPGVERSNYQVAWDNGMVGFITGVVNRGTATAEVRAVGPPGEHVLQVWRNYRGVPFLQNNTQSPFGPVAGERQSTWTVEVTEQSATPDPYWVDPMYDEEALGVHLPDPDRETDAQLEISPTSGQAGDTATLSGKAFPANTEIDLVWYSHGGHRPLDIDITPNAKPEILPTVTTDENGGFDHEFTIPNEMGATRPIMAEIDGESVAVTGFMMQPKIVDMSPTSGPVGTEIEFEVTGIGWPLYENAYHFVYDNKPLGYICSLDEEDGILRTKLRATGEPGYHFIDVYPSLFETETDEPNFTTKPHLSYWDNHPVRPLPALHFAFEITE